MAYQYPAMVAFTSNGNSVVKNTTFQVYATTDATYANPLPITDTQGNTLANLNSGQQGVFPAFQQNQYMSVVVSDVPNHHFAWTVPAALTGAVLQWAPNTYYTAGQPVIEPSGALVTAATAHVSGSTYTIKNWTGTQTGLATATANVPGLLAYFDPDVQAGTNGSNVTYWQSRFGGFALNRTLTTKPTLLSAVQNGHNAIRFTPSSYLGNSDTFGAGGLGVISGWALPLTFGFVFRISTDWAQSNDSVIFGSTAVTVRIATAGQGMHANAGSDSTKYCQPLNDGAWHVAVVTIGSGGAVVYIDGYVSTVSTAAIGTNTMNSLFVGPGQGSAPTAGTIDFGDIIVTNQAASPSQTDLLTQNLAKKWGLS